ncbi:hypothetical protein [Micromonospora sp. 067-2]|uniref:hypothetical protein n=1 Tax=Micromonospora sp. 067-2 TaxID=2789270 RepID=UPI00397B1959
MNLTSLRALAPLAALAGLAACTSNPPVSSAGSSTASPAPSTAYTSEAAPSALSSASPTRSAVSATPTATKAPCPVGVETLQRVSGLGKTHRLDPDHVKCVRRWAVTGVKAVDPSMQGDGVMVFEYAAGSWKKVGEGSPFECKPFGIPAEIGDQIGCRDSD